VLPNLKKGERLLVDFGEVLKLHEINPSLPRFRLRNERLWAREEARNLGLSEPRLFACLPETVQEELVFSEVPARFQLLPRGFLGSFYRGTNPYPKIEYCTAMRPGRRIGTILAPSPVLRSLTEPPAMVLTEIAKDSWSSKRTKRSVEVRHAVVSC